MSENELRRLLADVVPASPSTPDRVAAARRLAARRTRRRGVGAGLAVALTIGTGLVLAGITRDNKPDPAKPAEEGLACHDFGTDVVDDPQFYSRPAALAPQVDRARLCVAAASGHVQVPLDDLTDGAKDLARQIDALPRSKASKLCRGPGLTTFDIVFRLANGLTEVVWLDTQVCGGVEVNHVRLGTEADAARIRDLYLRLLSRQRERLGSPEKLVKISLACDGGSRWASAIPVYPPPVLTRAVICPTPIRNNADLGVELSEHQVAVLAKDLVDRAREIPQNYGPGCRQKHPSFWIVGQSGWGDRFRLEWRCGTFELGGEYHVWTPGSTARLVLDEYVHETLGPLQ